MTVAAADIVSILANNGNGTVAVSSATSFTGTAANVAAVASSGDVTTGTNFNSTLSSGTAAASDIAAIEAGNGSGTIDGSSVTTITGTAAAVVQAIADIDTDPTNFNSTLSDSGAVGQCHRYCFDFGEQW